MGAAGRRWVVGDAAVPQVERQHEVYDKDGRGDDRDRGEHAGAARPDAPRADGDEREDGRQVDEGVVTSPGSPGSRTSDTDSQYRPAGEAGAEGEPPPPPDGPNAVAVRVRKADAVQRTTNVAHAAPRTIRRRGRRRR